MELAFHPEKITNELAILSIKQPIHIWYIFFYLYHSPRSGHTVWSLGSVRCRDVSLHRTRRIRLIIAVWRRPTVRYRSRSRLYCRRRPPYIPPWRPSATCHDDDKSLAVWTANAFDLSKSNCNFPAKQSALLQHALHIIVDTILWPDNIMIVIIII